MQMSSTHNLVNPPGSNPTSSPRRRGIRATICGTCPSQGTQMFRKANSAVGETNGESVILFRGWIDVLLSEVSGWFYTCVT